MWKILKFQILLSGLFVFTLIESKAGRTLLYIADHLAYQNLTDLNLYKNYNLELTFIEVTNSN